MAEPFLLGCRGAIELEEGNYSAAKDLLNQALVRFESLSQHSLIPAAIRRTKAYLVIACANCGERAKAFAYLEQTAHYLKAIGEKELLERCRSAVEPIPVQAPTAPSSRHQ